MKPISYGFFVFVGISGVNFNICMIEERNEIAEAQELYGAKHISQAPKQDQSASGAAKSDVKTTITTDTKKN